MYIRLARLSATVAQIMLVAGGVAMVLMTLHTLADITARYFFNAPLPGTLEIATHYYLVPITFLPLAAVELRREHVVVEAFTHLLPDRWNLWLDVIVRILCIAALAIFTWRTALEAMLKTEKSEFVSAIYFNLQIWPVRWVLPISLAAFALAMLSTLLNDLAANRKATAKPL